MNENERKVWQTFWSGLFLFAIAFTVVIGGCTMKGYQRDIEMAKSGLHQEAVVVHDQRAQSPIWVKP